MAKWKSLNEYGLKSGYVFKQELTPEEQADVDFLNAQAAEVPIDLAAEELERSEEQGVPAGMSVALTSPTGNMFSSGDVALQDALTNRERQSEAMMLANPQARRSVLRDRYVSAVAKGEAEDIGAMGQLIEGVTGAWSRGRRQMDAGNAFARWLWGVGNGEKYKDHAEDILSDINKEETDYSTGGGLYDLDFIGSSLVAGSKMAGQSANWIGNVPGFAYKTVKLLAKSAPYRDPLTGKLRYLDDAPDAEAWADHLSFGLSEANPMATMINAQLMENAQSQIRMGVDPRKHMAANLTMATAQGILEYVEDYMVLAGFGAAAKGFSVIGGATLGKVAPGAFGRLAQFIGRTALPSKGMSAVIKSIPATMLKAEAGGVGIEMLQTFGTNFLTGALVAADKGADPEMQFISGIQEVVSPKNYEDYYETFRETAMATLALGGVGSASKFASDIGQMRMALRDTKALKAMFRVGETKTAAKAPEAVGTLIDEIAAKSPASDVSISLENWEKHTAELPGGAEGALAEIIGEKEAQAALKLARETGAEITMPAGKAATKLGMSGLAGQIVGDMKFAGRTYTLNGLEELKKGFEQKYLSDLEQQKAGVEEDADVSRPTIASESSALIKELNATTSVEEMEELSQRIQELSGRASKEGSAAGIASVSALAGRFGKKLAEHTKKLDKEQRALVSAKYEATDKIIEASEPGKSAEERDRAVEKHDRLLASVESASNAIARLEGVEDEMRIASGEVTDQFVRIRQDLFRRIDAKYRTLITHSQARSNAEVLTHVIINVARETGSSPESLLASLNLEFLAMSIEKWDGTLALKDKMLRKLISSGMTDMKAAMEHVNAAFAAAQMSGNVTAGLASPHRVGAMWATAITLFRNPKAKGIARKLAVDNLGEVLAHEIAHITHFVIADAIKNGKASKRMVDAYDATVKWIGYLDENRTRVDVPDALKYDPGSWEEKHLEQFATGFSEFLRSGKAPNKSVKRYFNVLKAAAVSLFGLIFKTGVARPTTATSRLNMTAAQRREYSTLFFGAEDQSLSTVVAAMDANGMSPMLDPESEVHREMAGTLEDAIEIELNSLKPKEEQTKESVQSPGERLKEHFISLGMEDKTAAKYVALLEKVDSEASKKLSAKMAKREHSRRANQWKVKRDEIREQVVDKLAEDKTYSAISRLQNNALPNGDSFEGILPKIQLNEEDLIRVGGEAAPAVVNGLGKKITIKVGGMSMNDAAAALNMSSGDELAQRLITAEPIEEHIDRLATERTTELYGPPVSLEQVQDEILQSIHTDAREELLRFEIRYMMSEEFAQGKNLAKRLFVPIPTTQEMQEIATEFVFNQPMKNVAPYQFLRAESKAAREAAALFFKGEFEAALIAKRREMMSHAYYLAAIDARDRVVTAFSNMKKLNSRSSQRRLGRARLNILEHVNAALYAMNMRKEPSADEAAHTIPPDQFITKLREDAGIPIQYPQELRDLLGKRTPPKQLTAGQILSTANFVKTLSRMASTAGEFGKEAVREEMASAVEDMFAHSIANGHTPTDPGKILANAPSGLGVVVNKGLAAHTRMEFLWRWLDANVVNGPWWRRMFRPFALAEELESKLHRESTAKMKEITGRYTKEELGVMHSKSKYYSVVDENLSKSNVLMIALNQGNRYNREALLGGQRGWTQDQVDAILEESMDERDWKVVQEIWDFLDSYWEQTRDLHQRVTGVVPEKVEADAFSNRHGSFRGGYFPIVFDNEQGVSRIEMTADGEIPDAFGGSSSTAMTKHGHLEKRTNSRGMPIRLDFSVVSQHVNNIIHDLAYREAIVDAWKMIHRADFKQNFTSLAGEQMYRELAPWLRNIAEATRTDPTDIMTQVVQKARAGATVALLGFNVGTFLTQITGLAFAAKELGPVWIARGIASVFKSGNPMDAYRFATDRSEFMRTRINTGYDREISDYLKTLGLTDKYGDQWLKVPGMTKNVQASFLQFIGIGQMLVDLPTWTAAYDKYMSGEVSADVAGGERGAIEYADSIVRLSQGATGAKDLPRVQRGNELLKAFTMFYSFFSVQANQLAFEVADLKHQGSAGVPGMIAAMALLFIPAVADDMIRGRGDDDDKNWMYRYAIRLAKYPFSGIIIGRDMADSVEYALQYDQWKFRNPVVEALGSVAEGVYVGGRWVAGGKAPTVRERRSIAIGTGVVAGAPTMQAFKTMEALHAWASGKDRYANPIEGIYRLGVGRSRENRKRNP